MAYLYLHRVKDLRIGVKVFSVCYFGVLFVCVCFIYIYIRFVFLLLGRKDLVIIDN